MSLTFVKTFKVTFPVWVDGIKTDETEERIKLLFREDSEYKGLKRTRWGSAVIQKDWTEETVAENYSIDEDLSKYLKMVDVEGSDYCKVVPC